MKQRALVPSSNAAAPTGSTRMMVLLTAAIAALGGLLFGYDTSVISGAMLFLRTDSSEQEWQAIVRTTGAVVPLFWEPAWVSVGLPCSAVSPRVWSRFR
jgi:hypothetical protein